MNDAHDHHGSCLCGAVAFTATGPLRDVWACHCGQCRRTSGHFWAATSVPLDRFRLTRDAGLAWYRSSDHARRGFCKDCGASLFWEPQGEGRLAIAPGAFDAPLPVRMTRHIFTEDAGDYYRPVGPPPDPAPEPAKADRLSCACLCGGVAFDLPGPAGDICACHCIQCRKLSGHYSASFDADEAAVHYGSRATLAEFQTPGNGRRGFCTRCGSSLYFRSAKGEFSIEAGAVTGATGGRLHDHIFTAFKGSYYDLDDGLDQS